MGLERILKHSVTKIIQIKPTAIRTCHVLGFYFHSDGDLGIKVKVTEAQWNSGAWVGLGRGQALVWQEETEPPKEGKNPTSPMGWNLFTVLSSPAFVTPDPA